MLSLITRALAIGLIAAALVRPATAQIADIVLDNGKIITVDDRFTIAQAVAIRGQRIIAVGRTSDLSKFKGPQTRGIALNGRPVFPGLMENHRHGKPRAGTTRLVWAGGTQRRGGSQLPWNRGGVRRP